MSSDVGGYSVYFIQYHKSGPVKIGHARDLEKRIVAKHEGFCLECREIKTIVKVVKWATVPVGICGQCSEGD